MPNTQLEMSFTRICFSKSRIVQPFRFREIKRTIMRYTRVDTQVPAILANAEGATEASNNHYFAEAAPFKNVAI